MVRECGPRIVGVFTYDLMCLVHNEQAKPRQKDGTQISHHCIGFFDRGDEHSWTICIEPIVSYSPICTAIEAGDDKIATQFAR